MNGNFTAIQCISPYSTAVKFYNLDELNIGDEHLPGLFTIHFDFELKRYEPSNNISSVVLKSWWKVFASDLPKLAHFELKTPFEFPDFYNTLTLENCKYLIERHKNDFLDQIPPREIQFEYGEIVTIDEKSFLNVNDLAEMFHQQLNHI